MSETVTPAPAAPASPAPAAVAAPSPSVAPQSGPAPDATLPAAAAAVTSDAAAPAAFSDAPAEAAPSILSGAKPEEAPAAEPEAPAAEIPAEAKPPEGEKPAEDAKEAAEPEKPAEPPKPPTYEPFTLPDGVKFDDAKLGAFTGILSETEARISADPAQAHAAMQEFGQKAIDLYLAQAREDADRAVQANAERWQNTQEEWQTAFRNDPQLGRNRQETTLARMGALMDMYGASVGPERLGALRDIFTMTGAGNHPEVLRFVNWMATRLTETARVVTPMLPRAPVNAGSPAQRLYRNSVPNQGAA